MKELIDYTLHLADNALILGHRNSEWTGHGPILEQDIAISNLALDLIGQARNFYQYAARLLTESSLKPVTEDDLAYLRDAHDFKNCLLVEQPNGDWAKTILRQFFFSAYQFCLYEGLQNSRDETLAAIGEKSLKEVTYHLRWSSEWVIRLGDGTEESHTRMLHAIDAIWKYTGECFEPAGYERVTVEEGVGVDLSSIKNAWLKEVAEVFEQAKLRVPNHEPTVTGGKEGRHTACLEDILNEMQIMQRTYPDSEW